VPKPISPRPSLQAEQKSSQPIEKPTLQKQLTFTQKQKQIEQSKSQDDDDDDDSSDNDSNDDEDEIKNNNIKVLPKPVPNKSSSMPPRLFQQQVQGCSVISLSFIVCILTLFTYAFVIIV
jgi:hypothetical protein